MPKDVYYIFQIQLLVVSQVTDQISVSLFMFSTEIFFPAKFPLKINCSIMNTVL